MKNYGPMRDITQESSLEQQRIDWRDELELGMGGPYRGLCLKCYGRHPPPRHILCEMNGQDRKDQSGEHSGSIVACILSEED